MGTEMIAKGRKEGDWGKMGVIFRRTQFTKKIKQVYILLMCLHQEW